MIERIDHEHLNFAATEHRKVNVEITDEATGECMYCQRTDYHASNCELFCWCSPCYDLDCDLAAEIWYGMPIEMLGPTEGEEEQEEEE